MSNIFNLLGGLAEPDGGQGQVKSVARSKTSQEIRLNSLKTMGGTKPKGLSIRSNSDMNISSKHSAKKSMHDKDQDCSKLKLTQVDSSGRPISPGKEMPAKKLIAHSSKEDATINKCTKKQLHYGVFKKPLVPKKNIKRLPKPEKLTYWRNDQHDFDYGYIENVEKEFKILLSMKEKNIKSCKEDTLVPDSETLPDIPKIAFDRTFDEHNLLSLNLPTVSDLFDDESLQ